MKHFILALVLVVGFTTPPQHAEAVIIKTTEPGIQIETYEQLEKLPLPSVKQLEQLDYAAFNFAPMGTYPSAFSDPTQCTYGVASMKGNIPWRGNANTWDEQALMRGITVSRDPIVGAVAQSDRGSSGHVAVVTAVYPDHIVIAERNYDFKGSDRTRAASYDEFQYIYL